MNIELLKENVVLFALSAFVGDFVPPRKSILDDRFAPLFVIKLCEFVDHFKIFAVVFDLLKIHLHWTGKNMPAVRWLSQKETIQ